MKQVLIILPNAFEVFEAAALIDVLGWANRYGDTPIETITAGTKDEIDCTFGSLTVRPNALLANVDCPLSRCSTWSLTPVLLREVFGL